MPTRFSLFEQANYFCSHIAECANIADFFFQKNAIKMESHTENFSNSKVLTKYAHPILTCI